MDQLGDVVQLRRFGPDGDPAELLSAIPEPFCVVYRAGREPARVVRGTLPAPVADDPIQRPGRFVATESGLRFGLDALHGSNVGIFADARPLRAWVRARSDGARVLNLFSYTSAFGVHAAAGGARSVTNVDVVPTALERGAANYALNGLPSDSRTHVRSDAFELLRRAAKRGETWDVVVVDPPPVPTVRRGKKGSFDPRKNWGRLARAAHRAVAPGGSLLLLSAARGAGGFEEPVREALPDVDWTPLDRGRDFPGERDQGLRALALAAA